MTREARDADVERADRAGQAIHIAGAYFDTKNYERARDVLRGALAEHPHDPALLGQHARAEYLLENYPGAASSAYAALSAAPLDEMAMRIYALSLDGVGRLHEAMWMAWRGVVAHPNEPLQHRVYARLLQKSRQLPSALMAVNEALRLSPTSTDALVLRGSILHDMGRIPESDASYQEALTLDPGNAEALNNMAVNRLQRGKFGHALRGFLRAAGSDPTLGDLARKNIGALMTNILRRVTVVATALGLLVAVVGSDPDPNRRDLMVRVLIVMFTIGLVGALGWLFRAIPRHLWGSVMRDRGFVAARIVHGLLAVCAGIFAVVFAGPWTIPAGVLLLISGVILARIGLTLGL
jgi:tetratricopeptide (TPR) repeat protein